MRRHFGYKKNGSVGLPAHLAKYAGILATKKRSDALGHTSCFVVIKQIQIFTECFLACSFNLVTMTAEVDPAEIDLGNHKVRRIGFYCTKIYFENVLG